MRMEIERGRYLNMLFERIHDGMVKAVTGIYRCGKTSLFGVHDNFKKVVLVSDVARPWRDEWGVVTMSAFGFLLDEKCLAGIYAEACRFGFNSSSTPAIETRLAETTRGRPFSDLGSS